MTMPEGNLNHTRQPVVAIVGPTAIGKSRIAIEVAKHFHTEVLTADSRQVYREMDVGTDKPPLTDQQGIPHRLIDLVDPDEPFNVGDFRRAAMNEISRLHRLGKLPLIVGGTGLYIRALLRGLCPGPPANWTFRKKLAEDSQQHGPHFLYRKLQQIDPHTARQLHPHDHPKIQRALEVFMILGKPLSQIHQEHQFGESPYPYLLIGLTMEREALYRRIEARVELEIEKGLIQETRHLLDRGYHSTLGSMKGLGYKQFSGYLAGDYSYDEAVRLLKRDTRHFAKRQMTWFRKEPGIQWITVEPSEIPSLAARRIIDRITEFVNTLNIKEPQDRTSFLS